MCVDVLCCRGTNRLHHVRVLQRGDTPLHAAYVHEALVQLLLANGALVNQTAADGSTTLMSSAQGDCVGPVRALLAGGATVTPARQV